MVSYSTTGKLTIGLGEGDGISTQIVYRTLGIIYKSLLNQTVQAWGA